MIVHWKCGWTWGDLLPTLEFKHSTLRYIQRINDVGHESGEWSNWLPEKGCPVDSNDDDSIEVEVFPDRPDLLSHETISKASRSFLSTSKTEVNLPVNKGNISMVVDPSLEKVRPVVMGAIVRDVNTGSNSKEKDEFIQSLMDHQEKLHLTLGRKRRFSSFGVHD